MAGKKAAQLGKLATPAVRFEVGNFRLDKSKVRE